MESQFLLSLAFFSWSHTHALAHTHFVVAFFASSHLAKVKLGYVGLLIGSRSPFHAPNSCHRRATLSQPRPTRSMVRRNLAKICIVKCEMWKFFSRQLSHSQPRPSIQSGLFVFSTHLFHWLGVIGTLIYLNARLIKQKLNIFLKKKISTRVSRNVHFVLRKRFWRICSSVMFPMFNIQTHNLKFRCNYMSELY